MSIAADSVVPTFHHRRALVADDLRRLDEPCVLFEYEGRDSDGARFFVYTVAGVLDGVRLPDGCTVHGEVIVIREDRREAADAMASLGLMDTISALNEEHEKYLEAQVAMVRLRSVGELERLAQAMKPASEKSDAFVDDISKVRPLAGDDLLLTVGAVSGGDETRSH